MNTEKKEKEYLHQQSKPEKNKVVTSSILECFSTFN